MDFPEKDDFLSKEMFYKKQLEEFLSENIKEKDTDSGTDKSGQVDIDKIDIYDEKALLAYIGELIINNHVYKDVFLEMNKQFPDEAFQLFLLKNQKKYVQHYSEVEESDTEDVSLPFSEQKINYDPPKSKSGVPSLATVSLGMQKLTPKNASINHDFMDEIKYLKSENKAYENSLKEIIKEKPAISSEIHAIVNSLANRLSFEEQQNFIQYIIEEENYSIEKVEFEHDIDYSINFVDDIEKYSYDALLLSLMLENSLSNILDNIPEFDNYILDIIHDELSSLDYQQDMEFAINKMEMNQYRPPAQPFQTVISKQTKKTQVYMVDQNRVKNMTTNYQPVNKQISIKQVKPVKALKTRKINAAKIKMRNQKFTNIINKIMEHLPQYDSTITSILKNEQEFIKQKNTQEHIKQLIKSNDYQVPDINYRKADYSHLMKYQPNTR